MTQLTALRVGLEFNYIGNEGGKYLGDALSKLTKLNKLDINVATKNFGPAGFHDMMMGLIPLTKVTDLSIVCGINRVGNKL